MSAKTIVTPAKAQKLLWTLIGNSIGGPGVKARLESHSLDISTGYVELEFDFTLSGTVAALTHGGIHHMKAVLWSPHFNGKARLSGVELDFDNVQNLIYDACAAMQIPYGWPCEVAMTMTPEKYETSVKPIFAMEAVNAA